MNVVKKFHPSQDAFKALEEKIKTGNENGCRDALVNFGEILAEQHNIDLECIVTEYHSFNGTRGDMLLCGTSKSLSYKNKNFVAESSIVQKEIVLFECKAAKLVPYKSKTNGQRTYPTNELIQAETQLIEYCDSVMQSHGELLKILTAPMLNIRMGGIIMGKSYGEDEVLETSHRRQQLWYDKLKITLFTWHEVLHLIKEKHNY